MTQQQSVCVGVCVFQGSDGQRAVLRWLNALTLKSGEDKQLENQLQLTVETKRKRGFARSLLPAGSLG